MPFDRDRVPPRGHPDTYSYGSKCSLIIPGAADQVSASGAYFKYFMAMSSGDVTFTPYGNADGETFTVKVASGQIIPGFIRRITAATAQLTGWYD